MLSGLLFIELIAHYYADIYDADKRGLISIIWLEQYLGFDGSDQNILISPHPIKLFFLFSQNFKGAFIGKDFFSNVSFSICQAFLLKLNGTMGKAIPKLFQIIVGSQAQGVWGWGSTEMHILRDPT
jgi:hypothetical protein